MSLCEIVIINLTLKSHVKNFLLKFILGLSEESDISLFRILAKEMEQTVPSPPPWFPVLLCVCSECQTKVCAFQVMWGVQVGMLGWIHWGWNGDQALHSHSCHQDKARGEVLSCTIKTGEMRMSSQSPGAVVPMQYCPSLPHSHISCWFAYFPFRQS